MPKFKVVNPDTPEEIDFYQDIPLIDPDTGADQLDSDGNILVKRYVNHTVSLKGINEVKNALPAIKTNTRNLEELYQYSHAQNEAHQVAINENSNAIVNLNTSTSEMTLELETLKNKINGIQGIDIDDLKDYVYTQVPLIKNSYLPLTGGTITGNLTIEEGTITGSLTGVASNATADVNNKKLTSYVADIMGANAQLSIIKGDGTTSMISINNVLNATNATNANHASSANIATSSDIATRLKGFDNHNSIYLGWDGNNLTMNVDNVNSTKGVVITHKNISSQSVKHATTADSATNATNCTSKVNSSLTTNTFLSGNQGNVLVNSNASAGVYTMLTKLNSTNGKFTHGCYQNKYLLQYTTNATINAGNNSVTKSVTLLNENGDSTFCGIVTAPTFKGALSGNATTATKASQNAAGYSLADTIVKAISISGRTITVTKLDGKTYTLTTQDTNTTYSKVSQFTNDSGYITNSHNFSSGVKVSGYTITVG